MWKANGKTTTLVLFLGSLFPKVWKRLWTCRKTDYYFKKILYTAGKTPWAGDQPVVRPLPIHRTTQRQNKGTQISMPQVGFEPNDPSVQAGEDGACGHCDQLKFHYRSIIFSLLSSL
jgi:hypothetical protein